MSWKEMLKIAGIALLAVAICSRIPFLYRLLFNENPPTA